MTQQFTVGRLLCGRFRSMLNELKFVGHNIEWIESSGLIERNFLVRADNHIISGIEKMIDGINKE